MYEGHTVAVVVPAYNEEGFVGDVIESVPDYIDRIYVVDDASSDDTWAEIKATARRVNERYRNEGDSLYTDGGGATSQERVTSSFEGQSDGGAPALSADDQSGGDRVVPIQHGQNRGVGGAIKTGYTRALEDGIDIATVMAGDDQMDATYLPDLLDPIVAGKADYAKGNRLLYPDHRESMSSWRLFGNSLLSFLTKIASGYWKTMDPQNGYTAISRRALETVDIDALYDRYGFANELLVHLNVHDLRVADVAIPAVYGDETSHIRYRSFVPTLSKLLLSSFLWRLRRKYLLMNFHPLALLYVHGAAFAGVGALLAGATLVAALLGSASTTLGVSAVLGLAIGTYALIQAMIYDMRESEDLEVRVQ
ncbi:glycosyltransferase family 2 protein [Natrononativus amylolyticus]|uniref:glycosyltransferase family 2 protein n=1 Tax=Natrononativus amylolyticus TaxID=2963434 RepID=UPI0020CB96C4|nr:glycosyltransferase family 2 protein [Natrononativus amylolyticus]